MPISPWVAPVLAQAAPLTWTALPIAPDCESGGRIDACTLVRGFLDASPLYRVVPRAEARVRLIVTTTSRANDDLVLLRFISEDPALPSVWQTQQVVDSRAPVDAQRAQLEPAFQRGAAAYLGITNPAAVQVTLAVPEDSQKVEEKTTPWGTSVWLGGWGSWTGEYQSLSGWGGSSLYRVEERRRFSSWVGADYSLQREPDLEVEGHTISLDTDEWSIYGQAFGERHLSDAWCVGGVVRGAIEDPMAQYAHTARAHVGVSRDWFPADDPRGNAFAITGMVGGQYDAYNSTNALGEDRVLFPTALLVLDGSVRKDTTEFGVDLWAGTQLDQPFQRYVLSASGDVDLSLGDHVDLSFSAGLTRQAIPGPAELDTSSYEAVTRADYAEPLSLWGNTNLRVHWDHTNGARNNRFRAASNLGATENL